jgi:F0F1-type ATP synthase beta subunit
MRSIGCPSFSLIFRKFARSPTLKIIGAEHYNTARLVQKILQGT